MALTTRSIAQRAERNRVLEKERGGVYATNLLPRAPIADEDRPVAYVANTDVDTEPGSHWVAFYFPKGENDTVEFFDSYGLNESIYSPYFKRFVKQCRHVKRNNHQFQSLFSDVCGYYASHVYNHAGRQRQVHKTVRECALTTASVCDSSRYQPEE